MPHVHAHIVQVILILPAPHFLQDLLKGKGLVGVLHHVGQKPILGRRELHRLSGYRHAALSDIHGQIVVAVGAGFLILNGGQIGAAKDRARAG